MVEDTRVEVEDLVCGYKRFSIGPASITFSPGEIIGLAGRSGAGKSTFITTLLGLRKPLKGSITIHKDDNTLDLREAIGYSAQENALFPFLSVQENIYAFGRLRGLSSHAAHRRMEPLLKRLRLSGHEHKKVHELSGGMKKRLDVVIALLHDPEIIILDEPFTGLDVSIQRFIWEFLKELASQGKIILVSSHLLADLEKHSTQVCVIHEGVFYPGDAVKAALKKQKIRSVTEYLVALFMEDEQ